MCSIVIPQEEGVYLFSDQLSAGKEACFKFCAPEILKIDIDGDGVLETEVGQKEPETLTVFYPNNCNLKNDFIYCKEEADECDGYHAENGTCVSNMKECTGEHGTGYKFWKCDENGSNCNWSDCLFLTQCENTYHLEPTEIDSNNNKEYGFICNSNTIYGKCVSNTTECEDMLGDCKNSKGEGGKINGTADWTTDGTEIKDAPGKWNFAGCSCETSNESIDGGIGGKECWYTSSGAWGASPVNWGTNCKVTEAVSCNIGYCQPDGAEGCQKAPAGYYHDNSSSFACQPCPIGATSAGGATGKNQCFMRGDSNSPTRFCDSVGCFNLKQNIPY